MKIENVSRIFLMTESKIIKMHLFWLQNVIIYFYLEIEKKFQTNLDKYGRK